MRDVMLDIETLGTCPGCVVLSIGAIAFDEFGTAEEGFYCSIQRANSETLGLHVDPKTEKWWEDKDPEAKKVLTDPAALLLAEALGRFNNYLKDYAGVDRKLMPVGPRLWGNGADFDLGIINAAYRAAGMISAADPFGGRCYRTVKNQFPDVKLMRIGVHHNALDDANSQAMHLVQICQTRGWKLA